ncbi:hypothetical protein M427DRAFT_390321 [Gonapodya prolifera JEL478]|uniref:Uncharacterized protein n=1 Tax=Gonapodya prolifera (strain JEL478) TaxID=1344416 RepID=A0A139A831_GONPJ|nr:hypothetical protein M427DRAFT_390321 [Gonapodya prolifera JEL478]|eukprot:KXS12887.1 hypothetical protein M427DRAFT_390321 [Gonapodya prolifera JEL478]
MYQEMHYFAADVIGSTAFGEGFRLIENGEHPSRMQLANGYTFLQSKPSFRSAGDGLTRKSRRPHSKSKWITSGTALTTAGS